MKRNLPQYSLHSERSANAVAPRPVPRSMLLRATAANHWKARALPANETPMKQGAMGDYWWAISAAFDTDWSRRGSCNFVDSVVVGPSLGSWAQTCDRRGGNRAAMRREHERDVVGASRNWPFGPTRSDPSASC